MHRVLRVVAVSGLLAGVAAAVRAGAEPLRQARETIAVAHRVAVRADRVTAELETPLRALVPGLRRLAAVLDDPVVADLPDTLRQVQDDVLPVLRSLADTHDKVSSLTGQGERVMSFVDETSRALSGLPAAALLGRRRPPPRVVTAEQVDPPRP